MTRSSHHDQPPGEPGGCDAEAGTCALPGERAAAPAREGAAGAPAAWEVLYVGDPMCSWCWGLSPALSALEARAAERGVPFTTLVGGLRPGGGDAWTPAFRAFLRHHWEEVAARTGQPFSYGLLDRDAFDYDTEPACRAVVVARGLLRAAGAPPAALLRFFASIQRRFYAEGQDPGQPGFYVPLCAAAGLDPQRFGAGLRGAEAKAATAAEFEACRRLGVSGFPTVLLRGEGRLRPLAVGHAPAEALVAALERGLG